MGMPSKDFWDEDPRWLLSYLKAYELKRKREEDQMSITLDYQSWLTGLYVHQGVQVALANSFSKRGRAKYVKEPISFSKNAKDRKLSEQDKEKRIERQYQQFDFLAKTMNKKLTKR